MRVSNIKHAVWFYVMDRIWLLLEADFLLFSPADHYLVVSEQGTRWCWLWLFTGLGNELKCPVIHGLFTGLENELKFPTAPKTHLVSCHLTSILLALLALSPNPFPACTHFFFFLLVDYCLFKPKHWIYWLVVLPFPTL